VNTRRRFLLSSGGLLLAASSRVWSQAGSPIRNVGVLSIGSSASSTHLLVGFKSGMQELGWREGRNIEYRTAFADGMVGRLEALAQDLVAQKVEVILVGGAPIVRAAQKATSTIPIVMANVSNAVQSKFIASLAKPGANITGITSQFEEVLAKLVEILHESAPRAKRIAVLVNESSPAHGAYWAAAQRACVALKLVAVRVVASAPDQLASAVAQIAKEKAQAIVVVLDGMYLNERARLAGLIRPLGLPDAYAFREHVDEGGLLSYGADIAGNYRHAATFVDRILKGAKPADLPVEQPTKFDLVVNLKTAKALGIAIPQAVLQRADGVIQ
jgi:putative ABC transport system substrate-binding protein